MSTSVSNQIIVEAIAAEEDQVSAPYKLQMAVIPVPAGLRSVVNSSAYQKFGPDKVGFDFELFKYENTVNLPMIGKFGFEWGANASFDYTIKDGEWEAAFGFSAEGKKGKRGRRPNFPGLTRSPKAKLYVGNKEINCKVDAVAAGVARSDTGIVFQTFGLDAELSTRLELSRYGLLDLFGPGLSTTLSAVPGVGKALKNVSIIVWLIPSLEGSARVNVSPFTWNDATLTGKLGLEGAYEPELNDSLKGRVYVGTDAAVTFGIPDPVFRDVTLRIYGGYELKAWFLTAEKEVVFVSYSYPNAGRRLSITPRHDMGTGYVLEAAKNKTSTWQPMSRPWRESGSEVFLAAPAGPARKLDVDTAVSLDLFTRMSKAPSPGAIYSPAAGPGRRIASDPALPTQAELPLLQNVFPESEPALAANGDKLMLLYVRDTGAANSVHFTEVAATYFNGTSWTTPAPVAADVRGQFEPSVAFDGQGSAVAVWTRIKDAAFAGTELAALASNMEIVSARWNPATGTWGAATALTSNAHLDHKPILAGPLTDGDLLLTWRENPYNLLLGTGAAGTAQNTRVMTRRWDAATATWGAATVLVADLAYEQSISFAARGNTAMLAWTRDMDGNIDDLTDCELFTRTWSETSGTWGPVTRRTSDTIHDRNARIALDATGTPYCVWQRGDDLVMDVSFSGTRSVVRAGASTLGFSDISVSLSPVGNVVVLWGEMGENGPDAHYRVYDPASATWGLDTLLSQDAELERSFSTAWDPMGNLVIAYNNVTINKETKTVLLEGGETVQVDGVPQPGRVDLLLAKRAIVQDLSIAAGGITASGTTYLPGDVITLNAKVKNSGNVARENVAVAFYDGDPASGGTLIQSITLPGWLKAADEATATIQWTIPAPALPRTVFVKVDPSAAVTESDETNNQQALPLNGVDLQLEYLSGTALRDGSARVTARVLSLSPPESPVTTMRLKSQDGSTLFMEKSVSQLAPGGTQDIVFDLPAGTQPEGSRGYRLIVDEEAATGDVETDNNATFFSLSLWIDDDNDGIPRGWEAANGMSDANPADAALDVDGDGFTAKMEFLAGTDPRNATSVLKVGEVAKRSLAAGGGHAISWVSHAGSFYQLERSYDLKNWTALARDVAATPPLNTIVDAEQAPAGKAFYRIVLIAR